MRKHKGEMNQPSVNAGHFAKKVGKEASSAANLSAEEVGNINQQIYTSMLDQSNEYRELQKKMDISSRADLAMKIRVDCPNVHQFGVSYVENESHPGNYMLSAGFTEDANGEELEDEREAVQEWLETYEGFAEAIAPDGDDVFVVDDAIADFRAANETVEQQEEKEFALRVDATAIRHRSAANETVEQSGEEDEKKSGLRSLNDVARAVDYWSEANDVYLNEHGNQTL